MSLNEFHKNQRTKTIKTMVKIYSHIQKQNQSLLRACDWLIRIFKLLVTYGRKALYNENVALIVFLRFYAYIPLSYFFNSRG